MSISRLAFSACWMLLAFAGAARGEPYLAVQQGYACSSCHVDPTGGGLRTDFGIVFAENVLPATGLPSSVPAWTGRIGDFLRIGGDLRASWNRTEVPNTPAQQQSSLDQTRVYADAAVIPDRLDVYLDEQLAPGNARTMEAYARLNSPTTGWYLKAGQFYLPFGWRLQDNTAFVREVSGISMTTPDTGIELGFERTGWSAQFDVSNGAANAGTGSGHQVTAQAVRIAGNWRLGAAASFTNSEAGNRNVEGLFAGVRTGPVAWLGEVDLVHDAGFPEGTRTLAAALGEANWAIARGHNLKVTVEYYDPDRSVSQDQQTRYSALYEMTPLPFVQLRVGYRRYRGIPQSDPENRRQAFLEVHAFL